MVERLSNVNTINENYIITLWKFIPDVKSEQIYVSTRDHPEDSIFSC